MTPPTIGPHFIVEPSAADGEHAELTGEDAHHLAVVLRVGPGEPVSLSDGRALHQARVVSAAPHGVRLVLTARYEPPPQRPALAVVHALPKARKLDGVVQRLTEIGADRLVPVHSSRSQLRLTGDRAAKAVARWRAVAHAAAKQSRRLRPLEIAEVGEWTSAFPAGCAGLVAWEESAEPLRGHVDRDADVLWLGIGPEGGLTPEEAIGPGLPVVSLGPTVLRTETAALVAATLVLSETGRLG